MRHARCCCFVWLTALSGCSAPAVRTDAAASSALEHDCRLLFVDRGALAPRHDAIRAQVVRTLEAVHAVMPIDSVTIKVLADARRAIPGLGIGGYAPSGREIQLSFDPGFAELDDAIATQLLPLLAHEFHHARRWRAVGYGRTLLEAIVSEGLADHFSVEVSGAPPPPWTRALAPAQLSAWTRRALADGDQQPYDHNAWFFGTGSDIPRWAGYSVGFALVGEFLRAHPDRKPSDLFGEPASSFVASRPTPR